MASNVPIVLTGDHNWERQIEVVIGSILLAMSKEKKITIIVVTDKLLNIHRIKRFEEEYGNVSIVPLIVSDDLLNDVHLNSTGLTVFTYCRLFLPQLLSEYEKCLYLDIDIIVNQDLSEILELDIENYYVAGVKDYRAQMLFKKDSAYIDRLGGMESLNCYISAGVMLMNLKKIRTDGIDDKFKACIGQVWKFDDQDIVNKCCGENKLMLPLKYNLFYMNYQRTELIEQGYFSEQEMEDAKENVAIVHYIGRNLKPWKTTRCKATKLWWEVAKKVLTAKEYEKILADAEIFERQMRWAHVVEACGNKKIVIWGYSAIGESVCQALLNSGINVLCFVDSDEKKWGKKSLGYEVVSFAEIRSTYKEDEVVFVISSQLYYADIENEIHANGYNRTVRYINKATGYYSALDEAFYDEEIQEIECKENMKVEEFNQEQKEKYCMNQWLYK